MADGKTFHHPKEPYVEPSTWLPPGTRELHVHEFYGETDDPTAMMELANGEWVPVVKYPDRRRYQEWWRLAERR